MKTSIALACLWVTLVAAASPGPPKALLSYIDDGEFRPGDFGWMRGAFPESSDSEKRQYQAITSWLDACESEARLVALARLRELGIADAKLEQVPITDPLCEQVASKPQITEFANFVDFTETLDTVKPIFDTLVATTKLAGQIAGPTTTALDDELNHRPMAEQIYRNAFGWVWQQETADGTPKMTKKQRAIFSALLTAQLGKTDRENTVWLKQVIAKQGWPTISMVGEDASQRAWLLAQHADHDPVFQLEVLRLMEPLLETREVSPRNYAYLYDRVMLKLVGTQRYATQTTCEGGNRVASPLENELRMPAYRQSVGLETFEEYLEQFRFPCPKD